MGGQSSSQWSGGHTDISIAQSGATRASCSIITTDKPGAGQQGLLSPSVQPSVKCQVPTNTCETCEDLRIGHRHETGAEGNIYFLYLISITHTQIKDIKCACTTQCIFLNWQFQYKPLFQIHLSTDSTRMQERTMARQRKSAEMDQPPSYEETVNSKGGVFTEGGGGAMVQTVVPQLPAGGDHAHQQQPRPHGLDPLRRPLPHRTLALLLRPLLRGQPPEGQTLLPQLQCRRRKVQRRPVGELYYAGEESLCSSTND